MLEGWLLDNLNDPAAQQLSYSFFYCSRKSAVSCSLVAASIDGCSDTQSKIFDSFL